MTSLLRLLAVPAIGALLASNAHANLLTNGSFESGLFVNQGNATMSLAAGSSVISGWTVVNDTAAWIGAGNPFGLSAHDGNFFLDLTNYQAGAPFAGMSQVIATQPGAVYSFSFDLGSSNLWGRPSAITASAGGTSATFTSPLTGTNNDWQHFSLAFTATSTATTVLLQGAAGINYIGLDNVSVDLVSLPAVPEPGTWGLLLAGLAVLAGAARLARVRGR
ncbi:DUF642 domain-containing protein [Rhizobacter fulvus]|jgi:hypothetical protein